MSLLLVRAWLVLSPDSKLTYPMELSKEQKLLSTILNKAWDDDCFKEYLISNPVQAIEDLTGQKIKVPEGKKLIVRDQSNPTEVYINIPQKPKMDDVELSEEQLDTVSGGGNDSPPVIIDPAESLAELTG